jgi:hypothetical protein
MSFESGVFDCMVFTLLIEEGIDLPYGVRHRASIAADQFVDAYGRRPVTK